MNTGEVSAWSGKHPGPYMLSAKMDGTSALWYNGTLYTRGNAVMGADITHVATILRLPQVDYGVRGELVMRTSLFDAQYKGKPNPQHPGAAPRTVNRNSVNGAIKSVNHIDRAFIRDMEFVAYEVIDPRVEYQLPPSEQFAALQRDGFTVAWHRTALMATDEALSTFYANLKKEYDYHVDGLVIVQDHRYARSNSASKNPDYARAFKEHIADDTAVTTVQRVHWEPSQYGYLAPTVVFDPVTIHGVKIQRATAHSAKDVQRLKLGKGAVIEVVYWGQVNPRVNKVLEPAASPDFPTDLVWKWQTNEFGERVNIVLDMDARPTTASSHAAADANASAMDTVQIKKIHRFLVEIGAKGVGEGIVRKIYTQNPALRSVGAFTRMQPDDIRFLGPQMPDKVHAAVQGALRNVDVPTLMAASKVFGRGLGAKKFQRVFETYPAFAQQRHAREVYETLFESVDGFARKTAQLAASSMDAFWAFVDEELSEELRRHIMTEAQAQPQPQPQAQPHAQRLMQGHKVLFTGFRNPQLSEFITRNGGTVQTALNKSTTLLLIPSADYSNSKVRKARSGFDNVQRVLTKDEFETLYMQ